jgi:3-hydroxybutyryl-CoA dehydratase
MNSVNTLAAAKENNGTANASQSIPYYFEDLTPGLSGTFTKTVTEADVISFAGVTGDTNPLHLDEAFAAKTRFKTRIVHGMLYASFISALFATKLPGSGAIYVGQALKFKAPVHIGDTVTARVEVVSLVPDRHLATFKTQCFVGDTMVLEGEATLMVPQRTLS